MSPSPARGKGGLTSRTVIASIVLATAVGASFAFSLVAIFEQRDWERQASGSLDELAVLNDLERLVVDMETGLRGFVITHAEPFLEPFDEARGAFPDRAEDLKGLTDDPVQHPLAQQIDADVESYIDDYALPLVAAARRDDPAASSVAATQQGKELVDDVRAEFDRYRAAERAPLAKRQDRAADAARLAILAAGGGLVGSVLLIAILALYVSRAIVVPVRRAATMAGRVAGGDLTARMPESALGEIGSLERSFNTMTRSLEASRAELHASRARVVAASDDARRRIERDLHDGTQQRLVSIGLELRAAQAMAPPEPSDLTAQLAQIAQGLAAAVTELQDVSRGIHPAILSRGGLGPALRTLARRSAVPVELELGDDERLPERVEVAVYYVVSEALTNAAKHARASVVHIRLAAEDGTIRLSIRDDGVGGADPTGGSGLVGLRDRIEALGGAIEVASPTGGGTSLVARIPVDHD